MKIGSLVGLALIAAGGCAAPGATPAPVGRVVVSDQPDSGGALFVGSAACGACHGDAYSRWRDTGHARAYAGLLPADRSVSACLRCHVTGYGDRLGYRAGDETRDLANVGCEGCHGPGADHAGSAHPGLVPTATGGSCPPCEINRLCRLCHTPERSPGFDLAQALSRVRCKP